MAWLYENSPGWRRFVNYTRQSKSHTAAFALSATVGSIALGSLAMAASSRDEAGGELEASLRRRASGSVDASVLAAANRSRLAVLLDEAKQASEEKKKGGVGGRAGWRSWKEGKKKEEGKASDSSSSSSSEERYRAALRGESLGTHSRGTTAGATAILKSSGDGERK